MAFTYRLGMVTAEDDDERRAYLKAFGMSLKLKRAARGLTQGEFGNLIGLERSFVTAGRPCPGPCCGRHATSAFGAKDVLRFLGRKLHPALAAEVTSDARRRPEGWRIKHRMARNSIKMYDKASVLRVETTINDPTQFRVLRPRNGRCVWCPMRKGVANLHRYYQVGWAANERYLDALAAAADHRAGVATLEGHTRPVTNRGRRHARLHPVDPDELALFRAALAGEHTIAGFRNADLTRRLYPTPRPPTPKPADDANASPG